MLFDQMYILSEAFEGKVSLWNFINIHLIFLQAHIVMRESQHLGRYSGGLLRLHQVQS
jgi:hypothetical protein